ncbi:hypothetical protein B0T26DRAFT_671406 [Lasiosphaeria miniovina]|uniref:Uncharacterized protein n=1 Tax=Lasiosphaeria miniovina TaxID=1954250 RepID=A0AA40BJA2_9PEZI|nr:uncharacterized protein B0T26DRAFT_671406 [Lasiosphaeria miniovina]KAK0735238.1 hypothetical protein B0T26DRAFT_671406 [Lasiosphaeria miniovina]
MLPNLAAVFALLAARLCLAAPQSAEVRAVPGRGQTLYCGVFTTADKTSVETIVGLPSMWNETVWVEPHGCYRAACSGSSGLYICNDDEIGYNIRVASILQDAQKILDMCCAGSRDVGPQYPIAGQQFTGVTNTIVALADCLGDPTAKPSHYADGQGNGECKQHLG